MYSLYKFKHVNICALHSSETSYIRHVRLTSSQVKVTPLETTQLHTKIHIINGKFVQDATDYTIQCMYQLPHGHTGVLANRHKSP